MSYPTYTASRIDQLAQLWSSLTGLDLSVARAQITAEQGVNGNPVGLENGSGQLMTFPTQEAGLQAAAINLKTNPAYAALRNAISTGNAAVQAHALAASPWGPSGYYFGSPAFSSLLSASPGPGTGTSDATGTPKGPSYRGQGSQTTQQAQAYDQSSANTSSVQSLAQQGVTAAASGVASAISGLAPIAIGLVVVLVIVWLAIAGVREVLPAAA